MGKKEWDDFRLVVSDLVDDQIYNTLSNIYLQSVSANVLENQILGAASKGTSSYSGRSTNIDIQNTGASAFEKFRIHTDYEKTFGQT